MSFTHLQIRSGYSFMRSTVQIPQLVERAKQLNYRSLALTDEGVLYHAIPFYKACLAAGIKPILGLSLQFTYKDAQIEVVVLAKSEKGYRDLINISTKQQTKEGDSFERLFHPTEDLSVIVLAKSSPVSTMLQQEQFKELAQWFKEIQELFSKQNVYIGLERKNSFDDELISQAKAFFEQTKIDAVALHDVRYVYENEAFSYDCLRAMAEERRWTGETIDEQRTGRHLRSIEEMDEAFTIWKRPLENTVKIAADCNVSLSFNEKKLPIFPIESGESADIYLKNKCLKALKKLYRADDERKKAYERLIYELNIINELGFNDYFLIVADFVQYAKEKGIAVGPGRGSAAGSIVAYLLRITDVDPLEYNLLFERFLNPERISMPDIDIDFSDNRRDEIIEYVRTKYGAEYVAQIITFGTFAARSTLREVMKTMDIAESDQKYILRHIPYDSSIPIRDSVRREPELVKYIKQSKKLTLLFQVATQLEGLPRHISTHAAGVVIGKRPLIEDVPLTKGTNETNITQYAMHELEAVGLLKMDILGLKNLTLIERIVRLIQMNKNKHFKLEQINQSDKKTFQLLQRGQTNGVFQFESSGMKQMLKKVKPNSLEDLIALNALYRPGPMDHIDTYTNRKHGREAIHYVHEDLEPILRETYGVLIYQEQIMQIVHTFASFSLGEADLLRRAISEKNRAAMESKRRRFLEGCLQNGYTKQVAEEIFRWIVTFANYGFNKSHSVAYSKIAYTLAYLKANYPAYFFAQLLSSSVGSDREKRVRYIREAQDLGLHILPPSINHSFASYTVEGESIRMGFMAIKGIGYETIQAIVQAREEKSFTDLFDFVLRVDIKRNALETLILAGCFDETVDNRATLLASITPALERAELFGGYGEGALFKDSLDMKATYVEMEDFTLMEKLAEERELLGTYISTHPLKEKRAALRQQNYKSIVESKRLHKGSLLQLIAYAQRVKKIRTRRGDSMAFVTLADETEELEAVIFSNVWRYANQFVAEDALYRVEGRISVREGEKQIIVNKIEPFSLDSLQKGEAKHVFIRIKNADQRNALSTLNKVAQTYPGLARVIIYNDQTGESFKLSEKYALASHEACIQMLSGHFGTENVVLK